MELIAYIGPMWSGKTTALVSFIKEAQASNKRIGVFEHPKNTRESDRDLSVRCLQTKKFTPESVLDGQYDVLIFDEVHLYDCFGNVALFLSTLKNAQCKVAVCAGIYYDFYNDYHVFPIWNKLALLDCEFRNTMTVQPCYLCGTYLGVHYTVNVGSPDVRVGDCYRNVCRSCGIQYRQEWKQKQLVKTVV